MNPSSLTIRFFGDPVLRKKCKKVSEVGPSERMLIESMIETMHEAKGIGLAAPQVGIDKRIFVTDIGTGPMVFVNPEIIKKYGNDEMEEGCLSIPEVTIPVKRAKAIEVKYIDEDNQPQKKEFEDLMARVIQHENDHLNGKMIVDYLGFTAKRKLVAELKERDKESEEK